MKPYSTLSLNAISQGSFGMQYITFGIQPPSSVSNLFGSWLRSFEIRFLLVNQLFVRLFG